MAAASREDRALMRVRGAGSRKVPTVDFGFNFAFGSQQQHQQVPTPARSLRSQTKTPQSRRSTSQRPPKTPVRGSREPSTARSKRQTSVHSGAAGDAPDLQTSAPVEASSRPAKRRRITQDLGTPDTSSSVGMAAPETSTRASRRRAPSKIFTIAEDEDGTEYDHANRNDRQQQTSPLFISQADQSKENETPKVTDPTPSGRLELDLQTTKSGRILLDPTTFPDENTEDEEGKPEAEIEMTLPSVLESSSSHVTGVPGTTRRSKPRRRKSLNLAKRRGPSQVAQPGDAPRDRIAHISSSRDPSEAPMLSRQPLANRINRYSKLAKKRATQENAAADREDVPEELEDGDESYVQGSSPEPATPAAAKKTSKLSRKRRSRSISVEASKGKKCKATFPILTHRLTNIPTLSTIHENEEEGTPFGDILTHSAERNQPNVVDVLAQICRETIVNIIERISDTTKRSEQVMAKNKQAALESFGKDLDDELFAMSEAVENRITMEARVRKGKRERTSLQSEYLELRREREQIALRCDAVRRQHWDCEEEARQKWALSEAARHAEQEMGTNEADDDEGLEFLLRSATGAVSSASGQWGILDKIKGFNAQLESMALFLEGKKV